MAGEVQVVITAVDNASGKLNGIAAGLGTLGVAATALVAAFAAAAAATGYFIEEGMKAEDTVTLFDAVLATVPGATDAYRNSLENLATSLSQHTRYSYDNIIAMDTVLLRYNNLGEITPQLSNDVLGLATLMGTDATSAAQQLGKGLEDIAGGSLSLLNRTRLLTKEQADNAKEMAKNGDVAGAQAYVLGILTQKVGGLALVMGSDTQGKMTIMANNFKTWAQDIGMKLLPALNPLLDSLAKLENNVLPILSSVFEQYILPDFEIFFNWLSNIVDLMSSGDWSGIWSVLTSSFSNGLSGIAGGIGSMLGSIDWGSIGSGMDSFGNGINDWFKNFDWKGASDSLAAGIDKVDWNNVGKQVAKALGKIRVDLNQFTDNLAIAVRGIDWGRIFESVGKAFVNFSGGLMGTGDFSTLVNGWKYAFTEMGQTVTLFTAMIQARIADFVSVWQGDWSQLGDILNQVGAIISARFHQMLNDVEAFASEFVTDVLTWITNARYAATNAITSWAGQLWTDLQAIVTAFQSRGFESLTKFIQAVQQMIPEAVAAIRAAILAMQAAVVAIIIPIIYEISTIGSVPGISSGAKDVGNSYTTSSGQSIVRRAGGGPVMAGSTYVVGENGPEVFVPGSSGSIIPNGAAMSGVSVTVNVNSMFSLADQRTAQATLTPIILRAIREARLTTV